MEIILNTAYSFRQIGRRQNQEDARYPDVDATDGTYFVVCDGVGGNEAGEVASSTVCRSMGQSIGEVVAKRALDYEMLANVLMLAYDDLAEVRKPENQNMATTMTLVAFHEHGVTMSHIGDSRIYQLRKGEGIHYRSKDHSLVQELVTIGKLTDAEARNHPQSNIITRSMSANATDRCAATTMLTADVKEGDVFLLCTDGVLSEITDAELTELLLSDLSDEEKMSRLAEVSKNSHDNNTAIMVSVEQVIYDADDSDASCTQQTVDIAPKEKAGFIDRLTGMIGKMFS